MGHIQTILAQVELPTYWRGAQASTQRSASSLAVEGGDGASIQARQAGDCRNVDLVTTHQGREMSAHRDGAMVGMMRRTSKR